MPFDTPQLLLLLIPTLIGGFLALRRRPPTVDVEATIRGDSHSRRPWARALPDILELAGVVLLVVALAGPQHRKTRETETRPGVNIMFALDLSGSMEAYDVPGKLGNSADRIRDAIREGQLKSRLDSAKDALTAFIRRRPDDRFGLIVFAGRAYLASPLTSDHAFIVQRLEQLQPNTLPEGTALAAAIAHGVERLREAPGKGGALVLITDGRTNIPEEATPVEMARMGARSGVTVHAAGVGSGNAVRPVATLGGTRLEPMPETLDAPLLQQVASAGGGVYFHAGDEEGVLEAMQQVDRLQPSPAIQHTVTEVKTLAGVCLTGGLTLLLLGITLAHTRFLTLP